MRVGKAYLLSLSLTYSTPQSNALSHLPLLDDYSFFLYRVFSGGQIHKMPNPNIFRDTPMKAGLEDPDNNDNDNNGGMDNFIEGDGGRDDDYKRDTTRTS
jgi:hypothetical protein